MHEETTALARMIRRFEDESYAEAWLAAQRWPDGVRCPACQSFRVAEARDRMPLPYRCRDCRYQFSVKSHSAMHRSRLPVSVWAQAFYLSSAITNPTNVDLRMILTISTRSAWHLAHRIREAWDAQNTDDSRGGTG